VTIRASIVLCFRCPCDSLYTISPGTLTGGQPVQLAWYTMWRTLGERPSTSGVLGWMSTNDYWWRSGRCFRIQRYGERYVPMRCGKAWPRSPMAQKPSEGCNMQRASAKLRSLTDEDLIEGRYCGLSVDTLWVYAAATMLESLISVTFFRGQQPVFRNFTAVDMLS